jgi:hypothetical protein
MSTESRDVPTGPELPSEAELLREARALLPPVDAEPRPGFAARVAARAAEQNPRRSLGATWRRWALGGGAVLAGAAALVIAALPHARPQAPALVAENDPHALLRAPGGELAMAQRLDLYENLTLVQNEDALEEMDVVAVLHELKPEAKP